MNEIENNPAQPTAKNDLLDQIIALRQQAFTTLLALVVVSGTLTVYLYRQANVAGKELKLIKPQAAQIIEVFKRDQPAMEAFVKQLTAYGVNHPDFQPILKKYGIVPQAQPTPAPVVPKK
jgi:hypothetical protein